MNQLILVKYAAEIFLELFDKLKWNNINLKENF